MGQTAPRVGRMGPPERFCDPSRRVDGVGHALRTTGFVRPLRLAPGGTATWLGARPRGGVFRVSGGQTDLMACGAPFQEQCV
jgi:hypothetical protein